MEARRTYICAVLAVGFLWIETATAQMTGSPARYPWDNRPGKCFAPAVEPVGMCREQSNWPDFPTTVRRLQSLLMMEDKALLHRAGVDLALGKTKFATGQYHFEAWYQAMLSQLANADDGLFSFIEGWRKTDGADSPALLIDTISLVAQAWRARGQGYAESVSPEAWNIFFNKLAQADELLDSASSEIRRSGPWHILKIRVAFDQQSLPSRRDDIIKEAIAAWPDSSMLYEIPMTRSSPAWGGSFELMDKVARVASEAATSRSAPAMYALVYERAFRTNSTYQLPSTKIDWSLAKQGFRDIEQSGQFPPWIFKNFANLACKMRDRSEAKRLYELSDRQEKDSGSAQNTDPCRAFAFGE